MKPLQAARGAKTASRVVWALVLIPIGVCGICASTGQAAQDPRDALEQALATRPDDPELLWDLGTLSAKLGRHQDALKYWQHFHEVEPADWRGIAKLIQTDQALGDSAVRDQQREALYQLRQTSFDPEIKALRFYCREQFSVNGQHVMAFEYFDPLEDFYPQPGMHIFYRFAVTNDRDVEQYYLSLGSYDTTNQYLWESGKLPKDKRVYHLNGTTYAS